MKRIYSILRAKKLNEKIRYEQKKKKKKKFVEYTNFFNGYYKTNPIRSF